MNFMLVGSKQNIIKGRNCSQEIRYKKYIVDILVAFPLIPTSREKEEEKKVPTTHTHTKYTFIVKRIHIIFYYRTEPAAVPFTHKKKKKRRKFFHLTKIFINFLPNNFFLSPQPRECNLYSSKQQAQKKTCETDGM